MKQRLLELVRETSSAESVYADKYEWLMRWALHFCNGDKEMAEDLVQDTFMRMISSWKTIRDLENPERFLYTYLKYGFLRLRAEDRRQTMQTISIADLDTFDSRLSESGTDLLEWQQDLRAVVDFLCWRKTTAKSASLLLLRFFHGLFPAEIMQVARLSRKAVDDGLASARHEARTCAVKKSTGSGSISRNRERAPHTFVPHAVMAVPSTEEFMRQMLSFVFAAKDGECLSLVALRERFTEPSRSPIDCWLLSHVVSCQRCLDCVLDMHALPPRGTRPLEDILGYAPKAEGAKSRKKAAPVSAAMRSMTAARARYRETLEHRPRSISVVVDGQNLASRDVSSTLNKLTVDLRAGRAPELIEVSGDTLLLLAVPVMDTPPNVAPIQHFQVDLNRGRTLELALEFHAAGVRLHVIYTDPLFLESLVPSASSEQHQGLAVVDSPGERDEDSAVFGRGVPSKVAEWLRRPFEGWFKLSMAFAGAGLICVASYRYTQRPQPYALLTQAVKAVRQQNTGIVTQRVRIVSRTTHGASSYDVTLHRDLAQKLKSKRMQPSHAATEDDTRMDLAKIAWNDPLSPSSFRQWRDEQREASDELIEASNGLVTVTSNAASGPVREESLTVDAKTFHAVGRKVRFRDGEDIEVAELDYRVDPLASSDPAWFEPLAAVDVVRGSNASVLSVPKVKVEHPTDGQLDIAELNVRLALVELQADGRERLTIRRTNECVVVEGLVATDERKQEIDRKMRQLAHVTSAIQTFANFAFATSAKQGTKHGVTSDGQNGIESVAVSSATDVLSPLDKLAPEHHLSVEQVGAIHSKLLRVAVELRHSATAMRDLDGRFHNDSQARDEVELRSKLMGVYATRIKTATEQEAAVLHELGIVAGNESEAPDAALWNVAMDNAQLCFELISQQTEAPRPAQTILRELAASVGTMQRSIYGRTNGPMNGRQQNAQAEGTGSAS